MRDFKERSLGWVVNKGDTWVKSDNVVVGHFDIKLIFLTKSFFHMTKKSTQKFKYLENFLWFDVLRFVSCKFIFTEKVKKYTRLKIKKKIK